jgi:hypothetical protein
MNRFRKLGFIEYNDRIKVHKSLLNAVLLDQIPKRSPERPPASATARIRSKPVMHIQHGQIEQIGVECGVY